MARPKGSGGRSSYDKYRRFGHRSSITSHRNPNTGKFSKKPVRRTRKKSRFDK